MPLHAAAVDVVADPTAYRLNPATRSRIHHASSAGTAGGGGTSSDTNGAQYPAAGSLGKTFSVPPVPPLR